MLAFAILSIFCLSLALGPIGIAIDIVPPFLWMIILFTGMFSFTTVFIREIDMRTIDGLRSLPSSPQAILLGKTFFCLVLMIIVEACLVPLSMVFFNYSFNSNPFLVLLLFILGSFDIAIIGSMISALTMYAESRTLMIPFLTFPLILGVLIPCITGTSKLMIGVGLFDILPELRFLIVFLLAISVISWLTFEYVFYE
jgi:heme exporter protein B